MKLKRRVEIVVVSDVHLGTYGCQAKELLTYLNSIHPNTLILNGDIIDIWQFSKRYFPPTHLYILKKIIDMAANGTEVIYITGNHDEMLRKFSDAEMGNIAIVDKLVLKLNGKKAWFFHGDVFDVSVQKAKWLAKLGGYGYDILILINSVVNWILLKMGREKYSLSKRIKNSVKRAVKFVNDFETVASDLAIENGFDYVVCGHIHQPKMIEKSNKNGSTIYLNSGDWVENLTALEYQFNRWKIYNFNDDKLVPFSVNDDVKNIEIKDLVQSITDYSLEIEEEEQERKIG